MSKRDYYEVLALARGTSNSEIKKAYRRMAMKYHPDRNPGDKRAEERFKEAKEAYEVLSDDSKRNVYDQHGHAGLDQSAGMGGFSGGASVSDVFGDVFGDIFGGGRQQSGFRAQRGSDLKYNLETSLEEAVRGTSVKIKLPTLVNCGVCRGSGAKKGTTAKKCAGCGGSGQVRMQQGFFSIQQTCPRCRGAGETVNEHCAPCQGQGRIKEYKTLSIKVPPGVDNGDRIRLSGEGEAGNNGGPPGDLFIEISIKNHPIFTRDGSHLRCEMPISFVQAALGGSLEVPTLDGRLKLKIPPETQSGRLFRLRGKGVRPVRGGMVGDLLCRVVVEIPVGLSSRQKVLLQEFSQSISENESKYSPRASSWFNDVKTFFEEMKR